MTTAHITILNGDGIGPEVAAEGEKVLRAAAERFDITLHIEHHLIGGAAIDETGEPLPEKTLAACRASDAVLLGAVGGPKWDNVPKHQRPELGLLALRKGLGLYANIRPVAAHPATINASPLKRELVESVDLVVIRELTGGIYFGDKESYTHNGEEHARDVCTYSTTEIERVVRVAATLARTRSNKLTSVDKANVLETSRLWRKTATRIMHDEFPDVTFEHLLVDACAMHLIKRPADFDVIVTENMFGDILTDEASMLAGSIGLLPSASLGTTHEVWGAEAGAVARTFFSERGQPPQPQLPTPTTPVRLQRGVYEPIHGSAPDIAGKQIANPIGTMLSVALLFRYSLGRDDAARSIERAVSTTLDEGIVTADVRKPDAYTTSHVGDVVARYVTASPVAELVSERS